jgi:thiol:disulfide interchange protein DsbD
MTKQSPNPIDLNVINDYYEGLQISKESNKPIFLFFTGLNCENPKMANDLIKNDSEIIKRLNKSFVPVILHVDDRTKLPKERKVLRNGKELTIRTKGNEWAHIEISKFNNNSQPFIILIDSNEEILKSPISGKLTKEQILEYLIL